MAKWTELAPLWGGGGNRQTCSNLVMRNCFPRDPGPALNRPVGFKSVKQAGSEPFYLLLGLKFLLPCPQGLLAWHELRTVGLSVHVTDPHYSPDPPPRKRDKESQVGARPVLEESRDLRTPRHYIQALAVCHTGPDTVRCAHRLKLSFISKLFLVLWLNISSMYPGYIEKTPKHSKTFPEVVASSCVCCEHAHEHAHT